MYKDHSLSVKLPGYYTYISSKLSKPEFLELQHIQRRMAARKVGATIEGPFLLTRKRGIEKLKVPVPNLEYSDKIIWDMKERKINTMKKVAKNEFNVDQLEGVTYTRKGRYSYCLICKQPMEDDIPHDDCLFKMLCYCCDTYVKWNGYYDERKGEKCMLVREEEKAIEDFLLLKFDCMRMNLEADWKMGNTIEVCDKDNHALFNLQCIKCGWEEKEESPDIGEEPEYLGYAGQRVFQDEKEEKETLTYYEAIGKDLPLTDIIEVHNKDEHAVYYKDEAIGLNYRDNTENDLDLD